MTMMVRHKTYEVIQAHSLNNPVVTLADIVVDTHISHYRGNINFRHKILGIILSDVLRMLISLVKPRSKVEAFKGPQF